MNAWNVRRVVKNVTVLRTYVNFKQTFGTGNYLYRYIPEHRRALLTQLRLWVLPLEIETGRYKDVPPEERLCQLCGEQVEDKIHFICKCSIYTEHRRFLYLTASEIDQNFNLFHIYEQFTFLLGNTDIVKCLSLYIEKSYQLKNAMLYN